jgi:hypothetical protein
MERKKQERQLENCCGSLKWDLLRQALSPRISERAQGKPTCPINELLAQASDQLNAGPKLMER